MYRFTSKSVLIWGLLSGLVYKSTILWCGDPENNVITLGDPERICNHTITGGGIKWIRAGFHSHVFLPYMMLECVSWSCQKAWPKFTIGVYREVPEIFIEPFSNLHIYNITTLNIINLYTIWSKLIHHFWHEIHNLATKMFCNC